MVEMMLAQAAKDIGIGVGGLTVGGLALWVIQLISKRNVSVNLKIGGEAQTLAEREEARDQSLSDNRSDQIEKHLLQFDKGTAFNRDLCDLRHEQIEKSMVVSEARITRLDEKIDGGFAGVYSRLDTITDHLLDKTNK